MLVSSPRLWAAAAVLTVYLLFCGAVWWRQKRRAPAASCLNQGQTALWVVHASQTGFAQLLAEEAVAALNRGGVAARRLSLGQLRREDLLAAAAKDTPLLLLASTCGEGDSPDEAAAFVRREMSAGSESPAPRLTGLRYGLLSLGDRSYANFCGFGRRLDAWLQDQGASHLFPPIEVNNGDEGALAHWQHRISLLAGNAPADMDTRASRRDAFPLWRLRRREVVNPGSSAAPVLRLELVPAQGPLPTWEGGDLALIPPPTDDPEAGPPRAYSIASLPKEGVLQLLVRLRQDDDGRPGRVSGWLSQIAEGSLVPLQLRSHSNFHLGDNGHRPLILVATGTGMAGLRPHLLARAEAGEKRNWLVFGERKAATDFHFGSDIRRWQEAGLLARMDLAFSQDQEQKIYVQDRLADAAAELRNWLEQGAALYLCGSAVTLAPAIDRLLDGLLGKDAVQELLASGRYRRDVY